MINNLISYLPLTVLIIGLIFGNYFLYQWIRHRHRFFFFWSVGLLSLFWFHVPFILNFGSSITVTSFNYFFSFAFSMAFFGFIFILLGINSLSPIFRKENQKKMNIFLFLWFLSCLIFYFYNFAFRGGIPKDYVPLFVTMFLFFIPVRTAILFSLAKWFKRQDLPNPKVVRRGIVLMMISNIIGILSYVITIFKVTVYPPDFWYIALLDTKHFFPMEISNLFLLLFGFFILHKIYHRILDK